MPKPFSKLIEELKKLPSIGERTAESIAFHLFENREHLNDLLKALEEFSKLVRCARCHTMSYDELCDICKDGTRERKLMIVKSASDMFNIEQTGIYKGRYHVLGGLISLVEGITPEQLYIEDIPERISEENIEEVIFALEPSIEGEATTYYIYEKIKHMGVEITQIARGIPSGYDISHVDELTLEKAIKRRQRIHE